MSKPKLNVGVGTHTSDIATPLKFNCLNVDVLNCAGVDLVCDVSHLPFIDDAFSDVFCFHVLEHIYNPAKGLAELVRVASRLVEIEVPHRFGRRAKSQRWKKGDVSLYHVTSFKCMWFYNCLKNFVISVKVQYTFPRDLEIHVWVYIEETRKRIKYLKRRKQHD